MFAQKKAVLSSAAFFSLMLAACTTLTPPERLARVKAQAAAAGFAEASVDTPRFRLFSLLRPGENGDVLRVYIEGDGPAWPSPFQPPENPTPTRPIAFELALRDPGMPVAYLARPCQYLASPDCSARYWSVDRFSPEVLAAYQAALDALKARAGNRRLSLAGYSGGGILAALLAAERDDVTELLTVAAPLDTDAWVRHHDVSPLAGPNPADFAGRLSRLPQRHWAGREDEVVPADILRQFAARLKRPESLSIVAGYDHECCWVEDWPRRLSERK